MTPAALLHGIALLCEHKCTVVRARSGTAEISLSGIGALLLAGGNSAREK
jgi:hypothetical protein